MTADPIGNPESSPLIKSVAQPSVALESASPSPTQIIDPVLLAATAQPPTSGPSVSPKTLLSQTDGSHFHTGAEFAHTANSTGLAGALSYLDELPHPPWKLATADLHIPVSQPPSSNAISPLTPGLGPHGLYHDQPFEQRGKTAHTGSSSYLGATVGNTSTPSSDDGDVARSLKQPTHWNKGEAAEVPPPKKKSHARKQPDGHIKRARNAFILFRKHVTDSNLIPPSVEIKHQNISMVAAKMWREAPQEVRQQFQEQARVEKEEHQRNRAEDNFV